MYHSDAEILFPSRVTPSLSDLRGKAWRELVDRASRAGEGSLEDLAFSLMMIRLDGCLTCRADSYRAMRGCTTCARQAINRFKGTDEQLLERYELARRDVEYFQVSGVGSVTRDT